MCKTWHERLSKSVHSQSFLLSLHFTSQHDISLANYLLYTTTKRTTGVEKQDTSQPAALTLRHFRLYSSINHQMVSSLDVGQRSFIYYTKVRGSLFNKKMSSRQSFEDRRKIIPAWLKLMLQSLRKCFGGSRCVSYVRYMTFILTSICSFCPYCTLSNKAVTWNV